MIFNNNLTLVYKPNYEKRRKNEESFTVFLVLGLLLSVGFATENSFDNQINNSISTLKQAFIAKKINQSQADLLSKLTVMSLIEKVAVAKIKINDISDKDYLQALDKCDEMSDYITEKIIADFKKGNEESLKVFSSFINVYKQKTGNILTCQQKCINRFNESNVISADIRYYTGSNNTTFHDSTSPDTNNNSHHQSSMQNNLQNPNNNSDHSHVYHYYDPDEHQTHKPEYTDEHPVATIIAEASAAAAAATVTAPAGPVAQAAATAAAVEATHHALNHMNDHTTDYSGTYGPDGSENHMGHTTYHGQTVYRNFTDKRGL